VILFAIIVIFGFKNKDEKKILIFQIYLQLNIKDNATRALNRFGQYQPDLQQVMKS
jgi:hypothetical protein